MPRFNELSYKSLSNLMTYINPNYIGRVNFKKGIMKGIKIFLKEIQKNLKKTCEKYWNFPEWGEKQKASILPQMIEKSLWIWKTKASWV